MRKISISVRNSHKTTFYEKAEVRVLNLNITSIYYRIIRADFAGNMKRVTRGRVSQDITPLF